MSDLFGWAKTAYVQIPGQSQSGLKEGLYDGLNCRTSMGGEVREVRSEGPDFFSAPKGKREVRKPGLSLIPNSGKSGGLPFSLYGRESAARETPLNKRIRLENEIVKANVEMAKWEQACVPLEAQFREAHGALLALHAARTDGAVISKPRMMAAYDARVAAGHAWNGPRAKLRDAVAWRNAILKELTNLNVEIG